MSSNSPVGQPTLSSLLEQDPVQKRTISLPLEFSFLPVELLSKEFTRLNHNHPYRIHYLGPRPHSTLATHKKHAHSQRRPWEAGEEAQGRSVERYKVDGRRVVESHFVQQQLRSNNFYKSTLFYRAFQGMNPSLPEGQFVFNSLFQSGNLDCAIKVEQTEFDLFLRIDSNTKGHVQWFYFSVKNGKRKEKIKMNLCNLSKPKSLYQNGMQPFVFSRMAHRDTGKQWTQSGTNLGLSKKELRYEYLQEKLTRPAYYCLELEYEFEYEQDQVFFAYCVPYTFSRLLHELKQFPSHCTVVGVLGKSLAGIDIPIVQITDFNSIREKKNILITGRLHPGESNSSHMLQGFMHFLTGAQKEAVELRKRVNFFIIPMANPDGVILGNTRTSAAGKDLNRQFVLASRDLYPEVALIKDLARRLHSKYGAFMYLDFHGHSRKKNTFFYGPAYAINQPNYYKCRILPRIIEKLDPAFRFHSCAFSIDEEKKQTARAVMFQHLKIAYTFTVETSIGFYYDPRLLKTFHFGPKEWRNMGAAIAQGLSQFLVGYEEFEELLKERRASRQRKRPPVGKTAMTQGRQDEESLIRRMEQLKIPYNDKSLFGELIEQLRTSKNSNYVKELDEECDSDAHEESEEFDHSKMKEFHQLLREAAHKNAEGRRKVDPSKEAKTERGKNRSETLTNLQNLKEQLRFFSELQEPPKPQTMQADRPKRRPQDPPKPLRLNVPRRELKNSLEFKRPHYYRTAVLTQPPRPAVPFSVLQKKGGSQTELRGERMEREPTSFFGEYHLCVQGQEERPSSHQRVSLFRRQKTRASRRGPMDQSRFLSQTFLQKPTRQPELSAHVRPIKVSPPKSNNYEFKFDEIEAVLVAKEKFKEYYRGRAAKCSRSSVIGPASFYGIRQNINLKINNKKKFFSQEQQEHVPEGGKESLKIVKFS